MASVSFLPEIRLKEYGRESIEVIDNGTGVEEENIKGLSESVCLLSPQVILFPCRTTCIN